MTIENNPDGEDGSRRQGEWNASNQIGMASISVPQPRTSWATNSMNASSSSLLFNGWGNGSHSDAFIDSANPVQDPPAISSEIHDAARIFRWEEVKELCESRPEAAAYVGEDGWTALHHACNRRCPDIEMMRALINAYPDALLVTENRKGWTPLHLACRFKAPKKTVYLLLSMYPEKGRVGVSRPDKKGRLPLYYALRYDAPEGVVGLLLEVDASAVLEEDKYADSPLAKVWDDWAEKIDGRRDIMKIVVGEEPNSLDLLTNNFGIMCSELNRSSRLDEREREEKAKAARARLKLKEIASERWEEINLLLKAAFGFPMNENSDQVDSTQFELGESKWRVLHAVSAIKCHSALFLLAICLHPEQAFELDKMDLRKISNIYKSDDCNESNPSNLTALHLAASSNSSGDSGRIVLTQLLALNPIAAQHPDTEGSTPLHRIAGNKNKSDWTLDGVKDVYDCYENALEMKDYNGRLPLHRASSAITHFNDNVENETVRSRSKICKLLEEHADAASHRDDSGCLPMHLVAKNGSTWDVQVQSLYDANPAAVRMRAGKKFWNRLPLHFAAANTDSDSVLINDLIRHNPRAAEQVDQKGMFPLHLACESGHSWVIVDSIYKTYPRAIKEIVTARNGRTALHMAAYSESSNGELINEVARLYPNAIEVSDSDGRCPLHLACMSGKGWEDGLSSLVNTFSSSYRDKNGLLPFHILAFRISRKSTDDPLVNINRSSRCTNSLTASELDQPEIEALEVQQLSDVYEILRCYPEALN